MLLNKNLLVTGLAAVASSALAVPPTIHVEWGESPAPVPNVDYEIRIDNPDFPDVELNTGSPTWRIWSEDTDNEGNRGDIGNITAYGAHNYGVTVDGYRTRAIQSIDLRPSDDSNYANLTVSSGAAGGAVEVSGDITVAPTSEGVGGAFSATFLGALPSSISAYSVYLNGQISDLAGTLTATKNNRISIGSLSGSITINGSNDGPIFVTNDVGGTGNIAATGGIAVHGDNDGLIWVLGNMYGTMTIDGDATSAWNDNGHSGWPTFLAGGVTGSITVTGDITGDFLYLPIGEALFNGEVCAANISADEAFPENVKLLPAFWGPNITICSEQPCNQGIVPPDPVEQTAKSRYLAIAPANPEESTAIRVKIVDLAGFSLPQGDDGIRWLAAPFQAPEENSGNPGQTFTAAGLSCSPVYADWGTGVIQVFGAEIIPGSTYEIQAIHESCVGDADFWLKLTPYLGHATGTWGDVTDPFYEPGGSAQPDFTDISAVVAKFLAAPTAPIKAFAQLQPNVVFPSRPIDFKDISAAVSAFLGTPYTALMSGPCACPSTVTCGQTACSNDANCDPGLCINGYCTDACGRCTQ